MLKNYLKTGIRNILRHKFFSFINVFALAIAMSVCLLIILMLADQKSYDEFNVKKDRIYRILSDEANSKAPNAVTAFPLASTLEADYPAIETSTRMTKGVGGDAVYNNRAEQMQAYFANPSFFDVFSFELAKGDKNTALKTPRSMVITSAYAQRLFHDENPIGKTVEIVDGGLPTAGEDAGTSSMSWGVYTITGIIANNHYKSHLKFDVLVSSASLPILVRSGKIDDFMNSWQDYQSYTYVLLKSGKDRQDLAASLNELVAHKYDKPDTPKEFRLIGQKLTDITPGILVRNEPSQSLPMMAYYFLALLALVIMISACLNYTNLSIARALTRYKEIGVRKSAGANRKDLFYQFLSESVITILLALVMALLFLNFIKPAFKSLWINQYFDFYLQANFSIYAIYLVFALIVGITAGLYPAIRMSKLRPLEALKNMNGVTAGKLSMRKILSVSQFVISLFFIITSILIYNQFKHYLEFEYGFDVKNIINIPLQNNDYRVVSDQLSTVPGVSRISASDIIPATNTDNGISLRPAGSEKQEGYKQCNILHTDEHFINNVELNLLAGKNLMPAGTGSKQFIVVNEATVKAFGYSKPAEILGQEFESKWSKKTLKVIGVVEDFHFKMLMNDDKIGPLVLQNQPDTFHYLNVKIASGSLTGTIAKLKEGWKHIDAVHSFRYEFYDNQLAATYRGIFDVVSILGSLAFTAIVIACLGMLGMVTYITERRTKEVGIRKVLGAGDWNISFLLSREFFKILFIAILTGGPLSFLINNLWLQNLPNRVDFGISTVSLGALIVLVLGFITISFQTMKISRVNPVESLRNE